MDKSILQLMLAAGLLLLGPLLLLVARPLSTYLCLCRFDYNLREILFVSWGGSAGRSRSSSRPTSS
jgi:NhaP-type Na+/H+ and K+/H+ antiporter